MFCVVGDCVCYMFFFSSRRRHTRCALVTGVQTCALPISGSKLNIAALANDLEVSLGAVREALSMLQSEALVISEPQRGYTVSPVSPKELSDITEEIGRASCRERVCQYV